MASTVKQPAGVRTITMEELDRLGIDGNNRLYWDGKQVGLDTTLSLNWWQGLAIVVGGFGAGLSELIQFLSLWASN